MLNTFNPLSQQAQGMSGRAQRYTAPLSSFVSRSNMDSAAEPAPQTAPEPVTDMVEIEPGVFVSRGGEGVGPTDGYSYAPHSELRSFIDDAVAREMMGDLAGGTVTKALMNAGTAAAIDPSQIGKATASSLALTPLGMLEKAANSFIGPTTANRLDNAYDPFMGDLTAVERTNYEKDLGGYRSMATPGAEWNQEDPTEYFSPREVDRFMGLDTIENQAQQMTRSLPTQVGTALLEATPLKKETLQFWDKIPVPASVKEQRTGHDTSGGGGGFSGLGEAASRGTINEALGIAPGGIASPGGSYNYGLGSGSSLFGGSAYGGSGPSGIGGDNNSGNEGAGQHGEGGFGGAGNRGDGARGPH